MPAPSVPPVDLPGRSEPDTEEVVFSPSRSPSVSNATLPPVAAQRGSTSLGGRDVLRGSDPTRGGKLGGS